MSDNSNTTKIVGITTAGGIILTALITMFTQISGLSSAIDTVKSSRDKVDNVVVEAQQSAVSNADRIGRVEGNIETLLKEVHELREDLRETRHNIKVVNGNNTNDSQSVKGDVASINERLSRIEVGLDDTMEDIEGLKDNTREDINALRQDVKDAKSYTDEKIKVIISDTKNPLSVN